MGTLIQLRTMAYFTKLVRSRIQLFLLFWQKSLTYSMYCVGHSRISVLVTNHFSRLIDKKFFTIKQNILRIKKNKNKNKSKTMKWKEQFNYCDKTNAYWSHWFDVFPQTSLLFFKRVTHLLKLYEFCLKKTLCICFYHFNLNKKIEHKAAVSKLLKQQNGEDKVFPLYNQRSNHTSWLFLIIDKGFSSRKGFFYVIYSWYGINLKPFCLKLHPKP